MASNVCIACHAQAADAELMLPDKKKTQWRVNLASAMVVLDLMSYADSLLKVG